jgi:hypothetical protein
MCEEYGTHITQFTYLPFQIHQQGQNWFNVNLEKKKYEAKLLLQAPF